MRAQDTVKQVVKWGAYIGIGAVIAWCIYDFVRRVL